MRSEKGQKEQLGELHLQELSQSPFAHLHL